MKITIAVLLCCMVLSGFAYIQPNPTGGSKNGHWQTGCEVINTSAGGAGTLVDYVFTSTTFSLIVSVWVHLSAPFTCGPSSTPDIIQVFNGTYTLTQPMGINYTSPPFWDDTMPHVSSVAWLDATYSSKNMTILTSLGKVALSQECPNLTPPATLGVPFDVFTIGCPNLLIASKSTCPTDYDLVQVGYNTTISDNVIQLGSRTGNFTLPCSLAKRTTSPGYVGYPSNTTPIPTAPPAATSTPTSSPNGAASLSSMFAMVAIIVVATFAVCL